MTVQSLDVWDRAVHLGRGPVDVPRLPRPESNRRSQEYELCHHRWRPRNMHQPPRLLMFAAACGATLGATAAWRIAADRWPPPSKPVVTAPISASARSVHSIADASAPEAIAIAPPRATASASDSVPITEATAS